MPTAAAARFGYSKAYLRRIEKWDFDTADPAQSKTVSEPYAKEIARVLREYRRRVKEIIEANLAETLTHKKAFLNQAEAATIYIELRREAEETVAAATPGIESHVSAAYGQGTTFGGTLLEAGGVASAPFGITGPADWRVIDALLPRNLQVLEGITKDVNDTIIRELSEGIKNGEGSYALTQRLYKSVDEFNWHRAETFARTESIFAMNQGALTRYSQAGIEEVEWIAANDSRTCEHCAWLDGRHYRMDEIPNMPHPDCRCTYAPVIPGLSRAEEGEERTPEQEIAFDTKAIAPRLDPNTRNLTYYEDSTRVYKELNLYTPNSQYDGYNVVEAHTDYMGGGFLDINNHLRGKALRPGSDPAKVSEQVNLLKHLMNKQAPVKEGTVLFRGMGNTTAQDLMARPVGAVIQDKGFQSYTTNPKIAQNFAGNPWGHSPTKGSDRVIVQAITNGKQKAMGGARWEEEVIFEPGTAWKIVGKTTVEGVGDPLRKTAVLTYHIITVVGV